MKVPLKIASHGGWRSPATATPIDLTKSEPFIENSRGKLIHRVKTAAVFKLGSRHPHLGVHYWCGNMTTGRENLTFLAKPPEDKLICAICEARAVMASEPTSDTLAGKHVHKGRVKVIQACCNSQ